MTKEETRAYNVAYYAAHRAVILLQHAVYKKKHAVRLQKQNAVYWHDRWRTDPVLRETTAKRRRKWTKTAHKRVGKFLPTLKGGFRSGMERRLIPPLLLLGAEYEPVRLVYQSKPRGYKPDVVLENGIVLELKGWFKASDRAKMLLVKAEYPVLDIRMVLASPQQKLGPSSKTTQAAWCEQHGFPWANNAVPASWLNAMPNVASLAIVQAAPRVRHTT